MAVDLFDQVLGLFRSIRLLTGNSVGCITPFVGSTCPFVFADDGPQVLQEILDSLLFLLERVLEIIALKQHEQGLEIADDFRLRANRISQSLFASQQRSDPFQAIRNIVVTTLPVCPPEQLGPFGIVFP